MCSLILAWQVFDGVPVVVGANRDEALGRPSTPPRRWDDDPAIVAPRDEEAGGTWLGYNDHGVLVAITNRWVDLDGDRSRGLLVRDALREDSASAAVETVRELLDRDAYAGFNLVVADRTVATYLEWGGELRVEALSPGTHVVVNRGREGDAEKATAIDDALPPIPTASGNFGVEDLSADGRNGATAWLEALEPFLRDHDLETCVHGDGFGTRSASLIAVPDEGPAVYRFADGPPCETTFEPVEGQV